MSFGEAGNPSGASWSEDAVAQVGSIDEIIKTVKLDMPMPAVVKTRIKESHESAKNNGQEEVRFSRLRIRVGAFT